MSGTKYIGPVPRGVLPRATGLPDFPFQFLATPKEQLLGPHNSLTNLFKKAIQNPGVTQYDYFEENGYEYEDRATYHEDTNTVMANTYGCPYRYNHHVGSICKCCGLKD
jgi:hypothetical protein